MRTRSQAEIQSLDDELNLFEENDWDFMSVVDTRGENYEYFNDIRDADFDVRKVRIKDFLPYVSCGIAVLAMMLVVTLKVTNFFDDSEWRELNNLQSVQGGVGVSYVAGIAATPEELIEVSNTLAGYFNCVQAKGDYYDLDTYCSGKSQFAKKYYDSVSSVITIYDVNDCYARGLREFGSYYRVQRINQVLKKDDVYYCYVSVEYPTIYDVSEFINMHNQTFVRKFQGGYDVSEATVSKFLLEVVAENTVPRSNSEVCIKMTMNGDTALLEDDNFMLSVANDNYSIAVNQLLKQLQGALTA